MPGPMQITIRQELSLVKMSTGLYNVPNYEWTVASISCQLFNWTAFCVRLAEKEAAELPCNL